MLEEEFTGDERHEDVPVNWLRHGLLSKRMRWGSTSWINVFNFSSWNVRIFNLTRNAELEFWKGHIGPTGRLKGKGGYLSVDPSVRAACHASVPMPYHLCTHLSLLTSHFSFQSA